MIPNKAKEPKAFRRPSGRETGLKTLQPRGPPVFFAAALIINPNRRIYSL
jgi:hypothetical protein